MTRPVAPEAGYRVEAGKRAKAIEKHCLKCGCNIKGRKIYCGPCYGVRYEENIAANRHKYKRPK